MTGAGWAAATCLNRASDQKSARTRSAQGVVALVFRCNNLNVPLDSTEEAIHVKWWGTGQLRELMAAAYQFRISDAMGRKSQVAIRQHDGKDMQGNKWS